jgi:nucleotide-binding universal stress UspA family protein
MPDSDLMRRLLAYDGSPSARRALLHAAKIHRSGDVLGVIHVVEHLPDPDRQAEAACSTLSRLGIEAEPFEIAGTAARAICVEAERRGYDTIVVGRRNLRDTGLVLLGSVSARVVAGAHANVVVVA